MKFTMPTYRILHSITALALTQLVGALSAQAAYIIPPDYQCAKPDYYRAITEPADIPDGYTGAITLHPLPINVCVRRLPDLNSDVTENFTKFGLIPIEGSTLKPLKGATYNSANYEPIIGHFVTGKASTTDFKGMHPVLIQSQIATVAVRLEGGVYYFDKQTRINNEVATAVCPQGYSTIGSSKICYAQTNGLKLNAYNKVELIDLSRYFAEEFKPKSPDERCPLGYTMDSSFGSNGGICMPVKMVLHDERIEDVSTSVLVQEFKRTLQDYGVSLPHQDNCGAFQNLTSVYSSKTVNYMSRCMPALTAITCTIDDASRLKFPKVSSPDNLAITLLDTKTVDLASEFPLPLSNNMNKITQSKIKVSSINKILNTYQNDEEFILSSSATDTGKVPIWVLHTGTSCATLWAGKSGGYSLEPIAASW